MAEHSKDISTLNTLTGTLLDSVEGYRKAASDIDRPELASRFLARADEREAAARRLQEAVRAAGGNPTDDGTLLGGVHRSFLGLKDAITGNDDKAIINEVERGEDYLKDKFKAAQDDLDLQSTTRSAIASAWDSVVSGHDEMSALKHSMTASH